MLNRGSRVFITVLSGMLVATAVVTFRELQTPTPVFTAAPRSLVRVQEPRQTALPALVSKRYPEPDQSVAVRKTSSAVPEMPMALPPDIPGVPNIMPVAVAIKSVPRMNTVTIFVSNTSEKRLAIQANILNPVTQSLLTRRLDLAAYETRTFGSQDGTSLNAGDQITLQCPPFQDRVLLVP